MHPLIKRNVKRAKLAYLWVTRILLAPNRMGVPLHTRLRYAVAGGFIGDQVALYDLSHRSKREYLSEFDWYRSRWINEPFDAMLNNKVVCNEILERRIAVPRIFFIKNKGRLIAHGRPHPLPSADAVIPVLQEAGSVFVKPLGAGRGKGVFRLDARGDEFLIDNAPASRAEVVRLLDQDDGWFLSETIRQHEALSGIYPHTSNTIRLITVRQRDETASPLFAVLRIGTSATVPVDNGSRGGLVAKIDLDTGRLSEAQTLWSHDRFERHPDSQEPIAGVGIPGWTELKRTIVEVADELPFLQFIAWDVLLSEDGTPYVIEANTSSGVNIVQLWGPQRNAELGAFYRSHGVIK